MKLLPLPRENTPLLDVQGIYNVIQRYLSGEDGDRLFWMLAGKRTAETWAWFAAQTGKNAFDAFWHGKTDTVHSWEVEKYHLKTVQDTLREENLLPGLLQVVRNRFMLMVALELYIANRTLPPLPELWSAAFLEGRLGGRERMLAMASSEDPNDESFEKALRAAQLLQNNRLYQPLEEVFRAEYLASLLETYVEEDAPAAEIWSAKTWWQPNMMWDTPALLLAWMLDDATPLVRWLTPVQPSLAYRCATETGATCDDDALEALRNPPPDARVSPEARAEWGRRVAKHDTRAGVGLRADGLPDVQWAEIPAGRFQAGGDPDAYNAWAGTEATLDYPFWMATYQTTYAQYAPFLAHYGERDFWTAAGWEWKGDQRAIPDYWDDPVFHLDNHPVLGVSWYESVAFANWLNAALPPDALPTVRDGYVIRLATEAEWERAARYPDGRLFPFGNTYIPGSANVNETSARQEYRRTRTDDPGVYYLKRTTAVGLYPPTPAGIYDLSGNVWEWCLSAWQESGVYPENNAVEGTKQRVLRGGSWNYSVNHARGAARMGYIPDGRGGAGIRLVCAPKIAISFQRSAK